MTRSRVGCGISGCQAEVIIFQKEVDVVCNHKFDCVLMH